MTYPRLLLLIPAIGLLHAQTTPTQPEPAKQAPAQPEPAKQAPAKEQSPKYVRLFSGGISFSVLVARPMLKNGSYTAYDSTLTLLTDANTTALDHRFGAGATFQVMPWDHFAIQAGALYRETGYFQKIDYYTGTDNINTIVDERKHTGIEETTHVSFYDFPVTLRWYMKDRYERGWRWFAEAGGTFRLAERIRTSTTTMDPNNKATTSNAPVKPTKQATPGLTGGVGMEFISPLNVHFIPEVRYTRWSALPFNTLSTVASRGQIEVLLSFTF